MVELVDTPGLGPGAFSHAGSSPAIRTFKSIKEYNSLMYVCIRIKHKKRKEITGHLFHKDKLRLVLKQVCRSCLMLR